mmetsp:Transcript_11151/g.12610  ORF Transcript_11151/g.12610 Transcript_11151/m.12610 type:complete len:222 (-) Transcript_11151:2-667(-)
MSYKIEPKEETKDNGYAQSFTDSSKTDKKSIVSSLEPKIMNKQMEDLGKVRNYNCDGRNLNDTPTEKGFKNLEYSDNFSELRGVYQPQNEENNIEVRLESDDKSLMNEESKMVNQNEPEKMLEESVKQNLEVQTEESSQNLDKFEKPDYKNSDFVTQRANVDVMVVNIESLLNSDNEISSKIDELQELISQKLPDSATKFKLKVSLSACEKYSIVKRKVNL